MQLTDTAHADLLALRARWGTPEAEAALEQVVSALRESRPFVHFLIAMPRVQDVAGGKDLRGAPLGRFPLEQVDLRGTALGFAVLDGGRLAGTDFRGAELAYASLIRADLARANFEGCLMPFARLDGANAVEATFARAVLSGAVLTGADCSRCDLRGAICMGTDLTGARLDGANTEGARFLRFATE